MEKNSKFVYNASTNDSRAFSCSNLIPGNQYYIKNDQSNEIIMENLFTSKKF
jgi:hypothetical protein